MFPVFRSFTGSSASGSLVTSSALSWSAQLLVKREMARIFRPPPDPTRWKKLKQRSRLIIARKPGWLPPAPSKLYRIPVPKTCPPDENAEIIRLKRIYKTEIKSFYNYWVQEYTLKTAGTDLEEKQRLEEEEHRRLMEENRLENERVAQLREEKRRKAIQMQEEMLLHKEAELKEARKRIQMKVDEIVRQEKMKSHTFITRDKLEKAIEDALENPVNYNFAIDLDGNKYYEEPFKDYSELKKAESAG